MDGWLSKQEETENTYQGSLLKLGEGDKWGPTGINADTNSVPDQFK